MMQIDGAATRPQAFYAGPIVRRHMVTMNSGIDLTAATKTRALLTCGAIGGPLFIVVFLIVGATRADYSAFLHPISSLSYGDLGWTQAANFIITGLLFLTFAIGLRRVFRVQTEPSNGSFWGPVLLGLMGIGLIGAGLFTADPLNGYPPGTPLISTERSPSGFVHDLFGIPIFLGLPINCFVFSRRFVKQGNKGWSIYSALSGIAVLAFFILADIGFFQVPVFVEIAGLLQRVSIAAGWMWISLLAIHFLRDRSWLAVHETNIKP